MAENSRFWNGTSVGDAIDAPYDADTEFAAVMLSVAGAGAIATNQGGVFTGELNELEVTTPGAVSPAVVDTGRALGYGTWYENGASVNVAIPTPSVDPRIDRIVLRKDWAAQTIRITRIAGVEGGGAPSLVQVAGTTWDTPLAAITIETDASISAVTDERQFLPTGGTFNVVKSADEIVNNDSTLQNDNELAFAVAANSIYRFQMWFRYTSNTTADIKNAFTLPAGAVANGVSWGLSVASAIVQVMDVSGSWGGQNATVTWVFTEGLIITAATAGTVQLQWAQNTPDVSDTTVLAGSVLSVQRVG